MTYPQQFQQYPQQFQQYPQQFQGAPNGMPGYPMPGAAAPQPGQQPAAPLANGSLSDFYSQPSTGAGPGLKFEVGTEYFVVVARDVHNGDVQQQTNPANQQPAFFRDGRPKFVMKVPVLVPASVNTEGTSQWYCAGNARDKLVEAMARIGESGAPKGGFGIRIKCTGTRPSGPGMNPAKLYEVQYIDRATAMQWAASLGIAYPDIATVLTGGEGGNVAAAPTGGDGGNVAAPAAQGAPAAPPAAPPAVAAAPPAPQAPPPAAPPAPAAPAGLSAEQQELLAKLTAGG